MGNIGGAEILVILFVALVVLGPERLPGMARQIGKGMGEVRKIRDGFEREIHEALKPALHAPPDAPEHVAPGPRAQQDEPTTIDVLER
jgi:Tat protein translocase TatB subunit